MRYILFVVWIALCHQIVVAQDENPVDSNAVATNSFWDNWYGQLGVDMSLLFPSHHSAKDVFPNDIGFVSREARYEARCCTSAAE